jgi:pimeloyl-ACP methyl ester carboxylesterase
MTDPAVAWHRDRLRAGGVDIARFTTGSTDPGAPGLLLLHGLGHWTSAAWDRLVPQLDPGWRIVSIDLPGFGESERPDVAYDLPFFRRVVLDVASASLPARFALCGNSIGGMIAADVAGAAPERISHLALLAPAGFLNVPPVVVRALGSALAQHFFTLRPSRNFVRRMMLQSVADPAVVSGEVLERAYALSRDATVRRAFARIYAGAVQEMRDLPSLHARFAHYRGPALLAWGRQDRYIPIKALANARRVFPQATVEILERSGHIAMVEEPVAVGNALRALLREPAVSELRT